MTGASDVGQLVTHYFHFGWRVGLNPSPTFRAARYLNACFGLRDLGENPFAHYLFERVGEAALAQAFTGVSAEELKRVRARFDANWYLHHYPDVEMSGDDAFIHYMVSGWRGLRDPCRGFSTRSYLDRYLDIKENDLNPFQHWVLHGLDEGRLGHAQCLPPLTSWESLSTSQQSIMSEVFSLNYYRLDIQGFRPAPGSQTAEYVCSHWDEKLRPTPSFCSVRYIAVNTDLHTTEQIPILHFLFDNVGETALRALFNGVSADDMQLVCEQFDADWYLYRYPDIEAAGVDAFIHYLVFGWRERRDPSHDFSTSAYLFRYPDIAEGGINPFLHWVLHGKAEGRSGASSSSNFRSRPYKPSIAAVLVNTETDPLPPHCLGSVLEQSYNDLSFLIVGSPLPDTSQSILDASLVDQPGRSVTYQHHDGHQPRARLLQRGAERTEADLLWFVQGDGVYEFDFVARIASSFADESVQLGFGRSLTEEDADFIGDYRALLDLDRWKQHSTSTSAHWSIDNLSPDVLSKEQYSFVWRRRELADEIWCDAAEYHHLSPWYLYLHMAAGGQIARVRDAIVRVPSYSLASSRNVLAQVDFYQEVAALAFQTRLLWEVSRSSLEVCGEALECAYAQHVASGDAPPFDAAYNVDRIMRTDRVKSHVLLVTHGIFAGGAENFPIQLANELAQRDVLVSLLIFKTDDINVEMRNTLNRGISIYEAEWVFEYGCEKFIIDVGCSLIHSHGVVGEKFFFERCACTLQIPYVATLHGSYEASSSDDLPEEVLAEIVRRVDLFVYTADKNLSPLLRHGVKPEQLTKMINAMPIDTAPFPRTRKQLNIAEDALVFTFVARGIKEKGWSTAIESFKLLQRKNPRRSMHLCLVGEGAEPNRLKPIYGGEASISFLGFQLRIQGLYRITDVAVVPTRFAGESYPLCIIQALQVAVPVIATDVGEIAHMLESEGIIGGVAVESTRDDKEFGSRFADAMQSLVDDDRRLKLSVGAGILGKGYDMDSLTGRYVELYAETSRTFAAEKGSGVAEQIEAGVQGGRVTDADGQGA